MYLQFGKVEITSVNTSRLKVLSEEETVRLFRAFRKGDKKAREELILGNLRLVLSVVQRFSNRNENPDDLFQVGCIGLMKAIDHFDVELGLKLSTYAVPMIVGEIKRYLRDYTAVRVSRSMRDIAYHAMKAKEELMHRLQREPSAEEIARELGIETSKVVQALESVTEPMSLYDPLFSDESDVLYVADQLGSKEDENDWIEELSIREALEALSDREKYIVRRRFLAGKTQVEVAREIGISQAQISRLEKNVLKKLRSE